MKLIFLILQLFSLIYKNVVSVLKYLTEYQI
jgi:hypothetical protein